MLTSGRDARARASPDTVLFPLPRCFVRAVFLLLPADTRLRCSEVSRAWRALLADTTFLKCLDLPVSSSLSSFNVPLLRAAVAKAGGQHRALYFDFLLAIITANAATLTELRVDTNHYWNEEELRPLFEAAPALLLLET